MTFPDASLADAFRRLMPRPVITPKIARVVDVAFVLGTLGVPLAGGEHVILRLGLNGPATILTWSTVATVAAVPSSGSVTVDVLAGRSATTLASICGSNRPALAAQVERTDQPPTGWSPTLLDPSWLMAQVVAVDGALEVVALSLRVAVNIDPVGGEVITDSASAPMTDDTGAPYTMEI